MSLGLGIDTGGTYTDAVLLDFEMKRVISKAKALTTYPNLEMGIAEVLETLENNTLLTATDSAKSEITLVAIPLHWQRTQWLREKVAMSACWQLAICQTYSRNEE